MEKFVSSLKRSKKNAELFHSGRKTKYNQLKRKLKTMLTENDCFGQDGNKGDKKTLITKIELGKMKKKCKDLMTIVDKMPKRGKDKVMNQKKVNSNETKIEGEPDFVKLKKKKRKRSGKPSGDKNVKNEIMHMGVSRNDDGVENNFFKSPGDFSLEAHSMFEISADSSISEDFAEGEETAVVNMDTTISPMVVRRKRGSTTVAACNIMQESAEDLLIQDDVNEGFPSAMPFFHKSNNNSNVILGNFDTSSPVSDKCFPPAKEDFCLDTEEENVEAVADRSKSISIHMLPSNRCIMTMKHPSEIHVRGKVRMTVIKGKVEVLGFVATAENSGDGLCVFSPERYASLGIQSCELRDEPQDCSYIRKLETLKASYSKLLKECLASDCVLLLQGASSVLTKYLSLNFHIRLFPQVSSGSDRLFYKEENVLQCRFEVPGARARTGHRFTTKADWQQVITDVSLFAEGSKTVVLGGKGVGKSTFLRFVANLCLSKYGSVLWLDFDPGQPEFTVPGCLSVVQVKEPLLGPNFTHQATPLRMVFLGEVDVSRCSSRYTSCVNHIVQYCRAQPDLQNIPWLINTMGYNKGLGIELAIGIIRLLHPTNVVHIESKHRKQNFAQPLRSSYVNSYMSSWSNIPASGDLDYATHILQSAVDNSTNQTTVMKPRECRELMVLAYLSQMVELPRCSLTSAVPYSAPLSQLVLAIYHEPVDNSHVLAAMNGSLVALCSCQEARHTWSSSDPSMSKILVRPLVCPCHGFGIVRGVDMTNKVLYLITPLPGDALSQVNCVLVGTVNLPACVYLDVEPGSGRVPYVTRGSDQPMDRVARRTFRRLV